MKSVLVLLVIVGIGLYLGKNGDVLIPDEAIRLRVIANSDSKEDQEVKLLVRDNISKALYNNIKNTKSVSEARKSLKRDLPVYKSIVEKTLRENNFDDKYKIDLGLNYFPEKKYKGVKYNEGYYESMIITLGNGKGNNWWCVLFPPLCLLESTEEVEEVKYKFFIKEIIDKYF